MKYAWYPGCVSQGACPELFTATLAVADKLGIELVELKEAACTGAGILSERNPELADTLNARTFAMAERLGLPTHDHLQHLPGCHESGQLQAPERPRVPRQGQRDPRLGGPGIQGHHQGQPLALGHRRGHRPRQGRSPLVERPLTGVKIAPFYGCYILRPTMYLGFEGQPERDTYIEKITTTLGGIAVDYSGKTKCCGFPILTMNEKASYAMAGDHLIEAKQEGADVMVTPCPLCHLNLDGAQPQAARQKKMQIGLPIIHLPQMIGLAFGIQPKKLGLNRHIVNTKSFVAKVPA